MINTIQTNWRRVALLVLASLTFFISAQLVLVNQASAAIQTVSVHLEKKFSGEVPVGYTPALFSFEVVGIDGTNFPLQNVSLVDGNDSTADGYLNLPIGKYSIKEVGPADFVPGEWRPGWYGSCLGGSDFQTTIVIDSSNIDKGTLDCQVDNQWRYGILNVEKKFVGTTSAPENFSFSVTQGPLVKFSGAFEADGNNTVIMGEGAYKVEETAYPDYTPTYSAGCEGIMGFDGKATCTITNTYTGDGSGGNQTGTLIVEKVLVNGANGTATTSDFSFTVNGGTATAFEADGQNILSVATGTYSIVETPTPTNYTVSYRGCTEVVVGANETKTCVITNTYNGGDSGGGDGDKPTYLVFGYVWHDVNSNTNWETEQPDPNDDESDLAGWTVTITNGSTTYSTTTDDVGYYYFKVPAGTWIISEILQAEWNQTFPAINQHVVEVIDQSLISRQSDSNFRGLLAKIKQFILPTAYAAQVANTYGPYNFGNVFFGTGGGGPGDSGNPGDGGKIISTGTRNPNRQNDSQTNLDPVLPTPLVLGETTEIIPIGAPNTGAGGTSPVMVTLPNLLVTFPTRRRFGV